MSWTTPFRPAAPADPSATEVSGVLVQVRQRWDNHDGTLAVLADASRDKDLTERFVVRGVVEGHAELVPNSTYQFLGQWREHERYGWQFVFDAALLQTPDDPDGLTHYLSRHADRVGMVTAARLVAAYGRDAVRVLLDDPGRAVADGLLGEESARAASASLRNVYSDPGLREAHLQLFALMRGHGFYARAMRAALKLWRASAPAQVRRDPFLLMTNGLPGCGFLKCDRLYRSLGHNPRRLKRQALAAWHALTSLDGDTWIDVEAALRAVRSQIGSTEPREQRACALLCRARLAECVTDAQGRVWIAERHKARSERACARHVGRLSQATPCWPDAGSLGLDPAADAHQIEQLKIALAAPLTMLTGSPGTGKTHVAALVLRALVEQYGSSRVAVCAPTGKAAVRITQKIADAGVTGLKATTIHSLLGVTSTGFAHDEDHQLPHSHVVLDEGSMPDVDIMASLLEALTSRTNLLIVGDENQLPPVGHGAFLRDLIAAGRPRGHLSEIRRNAGLIVRACHRIKDGKTPKLPGDLDAWLKDETENLIRLGWPKSDGPADRMKVTRGRLDDLYAWLVPHANGRGWDLIDDVQVICARNATRQALNAHLQARLNAAGAKAEVGGWRVGDKVICLQNGFVLDAHRRNGEKVYCCNGDLGRVKEFRGKHAVVKLGAPARMVLVPLTRKAEEEQARAAGDDDAGDVSGRWDLAYAVTCHKYQGSEVQAALVLVEGAGKLGSREWIYTAISRARSLCVLLGDEQDVRRYVANVTLKCRKTFLEQRLKGEMP